MKYIIQMIYDNKKWFYDYTNEEYNAFIEIADCALRFDTKERARKTLQELLEYFEKAMDSDVELGLMGSLNQLIVRIDFTGNEKEEMIPLTKSVKLSVIPFTNDPKKIKK